MGDARPGLAGALGAAAACYPAHALTAAELIDRADTDLIATRDWHQSRVEVATDE